MLYVLIIMISGSIQMFDEAFIIAGEMGGPSNQGLTLAMYMYANGFSFMKLGYATALGYIMAFAIFGLSFVNLKLFGRSNVG
jgi:ABC-type sugar transport system permease subunit